MNTKEEKGIGILALDDEQMNIELLRFILGKHAFRFCGVMDETAFWDRLNTGTPDLILLDVQLQEQEGFDICTELKRNPTTHDIPVIFLTGKTSVADKVRGFEAGGVDYVTKPFNEHELVARIQTHLSLVQARKRIEAQALRLEASNRLKDRIFSIIGHDLRSPLSAAKLKLDFVLRGLVDPAAPNFREETVFGLLKTMDEALNLLQNLMGWAKSESGELQSIPEEVNVSDLVEENFRLFRLASDHKSITLVNEISPDETIWADLNMLKTVLRNLLSNAIKFTPPEGTITVSLDHGEGWKWIRVRDTGRGISPEDIARILNPREHFSQLGTEKEPGTGLGLKLCQSFVAIHGGEMNIRSEPGRGSTFSFSLPVQPVVPEAEEASTIGEQA